MKNLIVTVSLIALTVNSLASQTNSVHTKAEPVVVAQTWENNGVTTNRTKAWWSDRTAGWVGGSVGSVVGIMGGVIGTLCGFGKARKLVMFLFTIMIVFGVASLVLGVVAVIMSQPYAVYYPPLLIGLICTGVMGGLYRTAKRSYQQRELRRMQAMDIS